VSLRRAKECFVGRPVNKLTDITVWERTKEKRSDLVEDRTEIL
jgi:hypothetical protein